MDICSVSTTFDRCVDVELMGNSGQAVFISGGLGHGFLALEENSTIPYVVSSPFPPTDEFEIYPLDQDIGIKWGMDQSLLKLSEKDKNASSLMNCMSERKLPN